MAEVFRHDRAASTYEVTIDGTPAGVAGYELTDGVAAFDHTEVSPDFGGRGVAGRLVTYAMDDVRATGEWKVGASCPYVVHWFRHHPEYADLLA
jgi:predicted GNAT family acetyltransferase